MAARVIVAGAGAAGLTAALRAAESGARVTLLNAHPRIGLKILMSGGTRCNVTHREVTERDYRSGSPRFVRNVLRAFSADQARAWLESLGVPLKLEETGKLFPVSDDAKSVLESLVAAVKRAGVAVESGARVVRVETAPAAEPASAAASESVPTPESLSTPAFASKAASASTPESPPSESVPAPPSEPGPESGRFRVGIQCVADSAAFSSDVRAHGGASWELPEAPVAEWRECDALVLATGGLSFPRTGSDGVGYALAQSLGHMIVAPTPALTPLTADDPLCTEAQGVTLDAELTMWVGGARLVTVPGSFLFTHFGYSGPAALDLSRHWLRAAGDRRVTASFLPGLRTEHLIEAWRARALEDPRATVRRFLGERLPDRLAVTLAQEAAVDPGAPLAQVPRERRGALISRLLERPMPVTGTLGYEKAEVTAGGVSVDEVDPRTMESRLVPGLYLCGEILDVEGRLGGFNFQWAWSSGTVAGKSAGR